MARLRRLSLPRVAVGALACSWLAIGLFAAFHYVHYYSIYRGFPVPKTPAGIAEGRLVTVGFQSPSVGRSHYLVYLPPGYDKGAARGKRYPVLYLLHGYPGKMSSFVNAGAINVADNVLIARHEIPPTILVMPAGKGGFLGSDTEWANTPSGRWMDYVVDVVHDVDHRFATNASRQYRGIAGLSEGAYGAVNIALHHLGIFSVVESWGGYFGQFPPTGVFANVSTAAVRANSPAQYVSSLAPAIHKLGLRVWLYQGRTDTMNPAHVTAFSQALNLAGADVRLGFYPGGHDWGLFRAQTPHMMLAAGRWFERRPGGPASFAHTGKALTKAALVRIVAKRHAKCLALPPSAHIRLACLIYRRAHGLTR